MGARHFGLDPISPRKLEGLKHSQKTRALKAIAGAGSMMPLDGRETRPMTDRNGFRRAGGAALRAAVGEGNPG